MLDFSFRGFFCVFVWTGQKGGPVFVVKIRGSQKGGPAVVLAIPGGQEGGPGLISAQCPECQSDETQPSLGKRRVNFDSFKGAKCFVIKVATRMDGQLEFLLSVSLSGETTAKGTGL